MEAFSKYAIQALRKVFRMSCLLLLLKRPYIILTTLYSMLNNSYVQMKF